MATAVARCRNAGVTAVSTEKSAGASWMVSLLLVLLRAAEGKGFLLTHEGRVLVGGRRTVQLYFLPLFFAVPKSLFFAVVLFLVVVWPNALYDIELETPFKWTGLFVVARSH